MFETVYNNLRKSNYKIEYPYSDKYFIFKIENFLDENSYNFINKNFPELNKTEFQESILKFSLRSNKEPYKKKLDKNINFLKIHNLFSGKEFRNYFLKIFFLKF